MIKLMKKCLALATLSWLSLQVTGLAMIFPKPDTRVVLIDNGGDLCNGRVVEGKILTAAHCMFSSSPRSTPSGGDFRDNKLKKNITLLTSYGLTTMRRVYISEAHDIAFIIPQDPPTFRGAGIATDDPPIGRCAHLDWWEIGFGEKRRAARSTGCVITKQQKYTVYFASILAGASGSSLLDRSGNVVGVTALKSVFGSRVAAVSAKNVREFHEIVLKIERNYENSSNLDEI